MNSEHSMDRSSRRHSLMMEPRRPEHGGRD